MSHNEKWYHHFSYRGGPIGCWFWQRRVFTVRERDGESSWPCLVQQRVQLWWCQSSHAIALHRHHVRRMARV